MRTAILGQFFSPDLDDRVGIKESAFLACVPAEVANMGTPFSSPARVVAEYTATWVSRRNDVAAGQRVRGVGARRCESGCLLLRGTVSSPQSSMDALELTVKLVKSKVS